MAVAALHSCRYHHYLVFLFVGVWVGHRHCSRRVVDDQRHDVVFVGQFRKCLIKQIHSGRFGEEESV